MTGSASAAEALPPPAAGEDGAAAGDPRAAPPIPGRFLSRDNASGERVFFFLAEEGDSGCPDFSRFNDGEVEPVARPPPGGGRSTMAARLAMRA